MKSKYTIKLAVGDGGELPTEFRLLVKGWNETENGRFLFDEDAATAVMSAYSAWGVDLSIDLDHALLEVEPGESPDPTARDARGWCKLELRADGSLWAVGVQWTPDGAARLKNKTQRYISPAFEFDPETMRATKMLNVALVAMPATHNTPALMRASHSKGNRMNAIERLKKVVKLYSDAGLDAKLVRQALDAIESGDAKAAAEILKNMIAAAAGADPAPEGDESGSADDGAPGTAAPAATEGVEKPEVVANAADEEDDDKAPPEKKAERKAMRVALRAMTGKANVVEQLNTIESWRAAYVTLAAEQRKLAADRAALEGAERRGLAVELIKLGAEFPATVWADDKAQTLKPRLANMPNAELRTHVAEQRAARPKTAPTGVKPPAGDASKEGAQDVTTLDGKVVSLSASEIKYCADLKCDPKDYAALKVMRDGKKG